jgi:flagellar hook-associated protein 1
VSDLFSALTSATRALEAQRFGLDVTGQNIANVNTPGYSRRVVDFEAVPPDSPRSPGRGVQVAGIRAQRDRLLDRRLDHERSGAQAETAVADLLGLAELALGPNGPAIGTRLNAFFDSFAQLAEAPTSAVARQQVVLQGTSVAAAFRDAAARFEGLRRDADRRVAAAVSDVNAIAARVAALNGALRDNSETGMGLQMRDEQTMLTAQLAELVDISVVERADGSIDIDVAGRALVTGNTAYALEAVAVGPQGRITVRTGGTDITAELTGGRIGGLLRVRDVHVPSYLQQLDEQAFALATAVNAIHAAGYDLSGNTGQNFFAFTTPPVGSAGAAAALVVDPTVSANPNRVAAAEAALPGDNRAARALANVRGALLLNGGTGTLTDAWAQLTFSVGRDVQTARGETTLRQQIVSQLETLRDQVSGVSLDEEAMHLMKFQRAYEANARFFQIVDETLDTLMATVGR